MRSGSWARPVRSRSEVARPASGSGKAVWFRLMPMPRITWVGRPAPSDAASARMPHTFRPCTSRSFGQRMRAPTAAASARASAAASPPTSESWGTLPALPSGRSSTEASRLSPGASHHWWPRRPRPARWWRAVTTVPSGAPAAASRCTSDWVESVASSAVTAKRSGGTPMGGRLAERGETGGELLLGLALLDEARALPLHHLGGGALHELRAAELALQERDLLVRPLDLLPEPLRLGVEVDDALGAHEHVAARGGGHRRVGGARAVGGHGDGGAGQGADRGQAVGERRGHCGAGRLHGDLQLDGRGDAALAAHGPDRAHEVEDRCH